MLLVKHVDNVAGNAPGVEWILHLGDSHKRPIPLECFLVAFISWAESPGCVYGFIGVSRDYPAQHIEARCQVSGHDGLFGNSRNDDRHNRRCALEQVSLRLDLVFQSLIRLTGTLFREHEHFDIPADLGGIAPLLSEVLPKASVSIVDRRAMIPSCSPHSSARTSESSRHRGDRVELPDVGAHGDL